MYINSIVEDKNKKFILKTPIVVSIIIVSIVALFTIFGMVDYFRAKNGKRPIFIYHKVNVFNVDVGMEGFESTALPNKEGITYYGVGYTVAVCDTSTQKYTFQLGNKKNRTLLYCTKLYH